MAWPWLLPHHVQGMEMVCEKCCNGFICIGTLYHGYWYPVRCSADTSNVGIFCDLLCVTTLEWWIFHTEFFYAFQHAAWIFLTVFGGRVVGIGSGNPVVNYDVLNVILPQGYRDTPGKSVEDYCKHLHLRMSRKYRTKNVQIGDSSIFSRAINLRGNVCTL